VEIHAAILECPVHHLARPGKAKAVHVREGARCGLGLLYQDVGRLVFDVTVPFPGETLFASAKAVSFEAFDPDKLGAAICTAVG
jgi:hypothetical protein